MYGVAPGVNGLWSAPLVVRWAAESLGLKQSYGPASTTQMQSHTNAIAPSQSPPSPTSATGPTAQDIRSFVSAKSPRSDVQFAATVAYYYQFVAPPSEKKTVITKEDLLDAFRTVGSRKIPPHPDMTLNNAYQAGFLDRAEKGSYSINSVGENFVTMTLPGSSGSTAKRVKGAKKRSARTIKGAKKKPRRAKA